MFNNDDNQIHFQKIRWQAGSKMKMTPPSLTPSRHQTTDVRHRRQPGEREGQARVPGLRLGPFSSYARERFRRRGSSSAGSTPTFASKYASFSIFQDLQENHLLGSEFAKLLQNFPDFCKEEENFWEIFRKIKVTKSCNIRKILQNFYRI